MKKYLLTAPKTNGGGGLATPPNNEIWYTSSDGNIVTLELQQNATDAFGANIVSNTYRNGKGIIKFAGGVTIIGWAVFADCTRLTSISIPNSVETIRDGAFQSSTSLTSINIPNSVTSLGEGAFFGCTGLPSVTLGNSMLNISPYAFASCTSLTFVKVETITPTRWFSADTFNGCTALTEILVPSASVDLYKAASGWSDYANIIKGY